MQLINIYDLKNYDAKLITEYLLQEENEFEIIIPRDQFDEGDKSFSIFWQYYSAAYAGQQLYNISEIFGYYVPCPHKAEPFKFQITVRNTKTLSLVLKLIIDGHYTKDDEMICFHEQASKFFEYAFAGKLNPYCWGLLYIANQFLSK